MTQGALPALGASLTCGTSDHLGTLGLRTFEVQHETLAQARVGGSGRCLELQREVGPRGEEAAARLRPSQLGQDSGTGTVPIEQRQHIPFAHIQAAGWGMDYDQPPPIQFCPILARFITNLTYSPVAYPMPQVWINYGLLYASRSRFHWLLLILLPSPQPCSLLTPSTPQSLLYHQVMLNSKSL